MNMISISNTLTHSTYTGIWSRTRCFLLRQEENPPAPILGSIRSIKLSFNWYVKF